MNKKIRVWIVGLILITLLSGCGIEVRSNGIFTSNSSLADIEVNETKNFEYAGLNKIVVDVSSTDINVITEERTDILVKLTGKKSENVEHELNTEKSSENLYIEVVIQSTGFNSVVSDFKLDIFVPKSYSNDFKAESTSGDISIKDFAVKNLNLSLSSGDIELKNIESSSLNIELTSGDTDINKLTTKKFDYEASSGDLTAEELTTTEFNYDVTSGDIDIDRFIGNIDGEGSSASINIDYQDFHNNIEIQSTSGDVTIDLPENAEFALNAEVSSGDITCNFPITVKGKHEEDSLKGTVISDKNKITIQASSGDIKIK